MPPAADALADPVRAGATGGAGVFRDAAAGPGPLPPADPAVCGCALPAPS